MYIHILHEEGVAFLQKEIDQNDKSNISDGLLTIIDPKTLKEFIWDDDEGDYLWKDLPKENPYITMWREREEKRKEEEL